MSYPWQKKEEELYVAVVNEEEQYSLWPASAVIPPGWRQACEPGDRETCLDYIREVWVDMRPLSLRSKT
ncbi:MULTISPECIES: MbtH family protein [Methylobacterium]|uniref:MbtH family protein n=1 Tax=Methylobacterium TaxID=407 RepID=UPI0013EBA682|nr:MbtH family NRPS accessory protein [Methylobacterium sp. DB0501]NGM36996.1 MbtH family NRPS accessory protein [Methylobacterium sp. DB0501]